MKKPSNLETKTLDKKSISKIFDSIEVIQWYQYQIYVKIMRALLREDIEEIDEMPKDFNGSAKVVLIGIDNSIKAW